MSRRLMVISNYEEVVNGYGYREVVHGAYADCNCPSDGRRFEVIGISVRRFVILCLVGLLIGFVYSFLKTSLGGGTVDRDAEAIR